MTLPTWNLIPRMEVTSNPNTVVFASLGLSHPSQPSELSQMPVTQPCVYSAVAVPNHLLCANSEEATHRLCPF